MDNLGLVIIILAWAIQLLNTSKKDHKVNTLFLIFYSIGAFLLVINSYNHGMGQAVMLNFASFVLAVVVFWRTNY